MAESAWAVKIAGFQCHAIQNMSKQKSNRSIDKVQNLWKERK